MLDPLLFRGAACSKHEDSVGSSTRLVSTAQCVHCALERAERKAREQAHEERTKALRGKPGRRASAAERAAMAVQRLCELAHERANAGSDDAIEDIEAECANVRFTLASALSSL